MLYIPVSKPEERVRHGVEQVERVEEVSGHFHQTPTGAGQHEEHGRLRSIGGVHNGPQSPHAGEHWKFDKVRLCDFGRNGRYKSGTHLA